FRQRRVVAVVPDRVGGAREQVDVLRGDQFGRGWREVACVAGVQRGAGRRLPHHANARTQLALGPAEGSVLIAAHADVDGPVVADVPLVLQVGRPRPRGDATVGRNVEGYCAGLVAVVIGREHQRVAGRAGLVVGA